jgi:hypothetical protein
MISSRTSIVLTISFACVTCIAMLGSLRITAQGFAASGQPAIPPPLSDPAEGRSSIQRSKHPEGGLLFNRRESPLVIRAAPGEEIRVTSGAYRSSTAIC